MSERAAMVYTRGGQAFVTPESQTSDGFWVATGPCFVEDVDSPERIAERVLEALTQSRSGVPTPPPSAPLDAELLRQAEVKSFATFMKGARAVRISSSGRKTTVTPMRNGGTSRGFEFKESEALTIADHSSLASAVVAALQAAE